MSHRDVYQPTPQPHHIPGYPPATEIFSPLSCVILNLFLRYGGHCPFYSKRIGETYGVATHMALLESSATTGSQGLFSNGQTASRDRRLTEHPGVQDTKDKRAFGFTCKDHQTPPSRDRENHSICKSLPECTETPNHAKYNCNKNHTQPEKGWCDRISAMNPEMAPMPLPCPQIPSCAAHHSRPSPRPDNVPGDLRSPCPEPHHHQKVAPQCMPPRRETTYSFTLSDVRPEVTANVTYGVHCVEPSYLPSSSSHTPYFAEIKHPDKALKPGNINQSQEWATLHDISPVLPPSGAMIYPTYTGMLPTYGGHVPGQHFRFGKTFGKATKDAKRWIRGDYS